MIIFGNYLQCEVDFWQNSNCLLNRQYVSIWEVMQESRTQSGLTKKTDASVIIYLFFFFLDRVKHIVSL